MIPAPARAVKLGPSSARRTVGDRAAGFLSSAGRGVRRCAARLTATSIGSFEASRRNDVRQTNPPFMSGVPELLVLRLLARREMYGYELVKLIKTSTRDAITLGEGVVYPALYSLEQRGALKARRKMVNGRSRVYYSVTAKGRKRLRQLTEEWERVSNGVRSVLEEPGRA